MSVSAFLNDDIEVVQDPTPDADLDTVEVEQPQAHDQIPTAVWHGERACSDGTVIAYLALRRRATMSRGQADARRKTYAADMGVGVRTVDTRFDELVERGWLLITPRWRAEGSQQSNRYQLLWTPIMRADDPRLVAHQEQVAAFDARMAELQAANVESGRNTRNGVRAVRRAHWNPDKAPTSKKPQVRGGARFCTGGAAEETPGQRGRKILHGGGGASNTAGQRRKARSEGAQDSARPPCKILRPSNHIPTEPKERPTVSPSPNPSLRSGFAATRPDPEPPAGTEPTQTELLSVPAKPPTANQIAREITTEVLDQLREQRGIKPAQTFPVIQARVKTAVSNGRHPVWVKHGLWQVLIAGRAVTDASLAYGLEDAYRGRRADGVTPLLPPEALEAARPLVEAWDAERARQEHARTAARPRSGGLQHTYVDPARSAGRALDDAFAAL